jgi:hypothetical protein
MQAAIWGADGMSVFATDSTGGGVYVFKVAEIPECRILPQFFDTDFTVSVWKSDKGQIDDVTKVPTHLQSKSVLMNADRIIIYDDYRPFALGELVVPALFGGDLTAACIEEERWLRQFKKESEGKREHSGTSEKEEVSAPDSDDPDRDLSSGGEGSDGGAFEDEP